jgi:transglutaminase-like putative cysteine protease
VTTTARPSIGAGWRHLPRDARDTLFQLAVIAWTILPHAAHLAPWCVVLAAAILFARARLALTGGALPSRWTLVAVLALAVGLTIFSERTLLGKEAGVTMLVVLMALKTLELRARRDAMVIFLLGFFLVLTHFLYSQTLLTALAMLVSVWGLMTALVLAHMPVGVPPLRVAGGVAARAALLGAPVMVALFVLFPRIAPLWGLPQDAGGKTGLSGTLTLGGVAQVANDDSVALRVRFPAGTPPHEAFYFRGPVLSAFDGREWTRTRLRFGLPDDPPPEPRGRGWRYEMTIEPSRLPTLPLLEFTPARPDTAPAVEGFELRLRRDGEWMADRPLAERVRVAATAFLQQRHGPLRPSLALREQLELPQGFNPRTREWAEALRRQPALADADPRTLVDAVLAHIRRDDFHYTLEPGPYGRDAIDEFWLDRKIGFCEHFAAAFVVVMRALDVPARIVTGYQGADPTPDADGWYVVRQSNAHAWAEVWLGDEGWVRVDPTAAVAPDRVRSGRGLPVSPGLVANALGTMSPRLALTLQLFWERIDNRWNLWVLNYSRRQQFDLLGALGVRSPSWEDLAYALAALLSGAAAIGAGWAIWDRHRQDPWQRLQQRVQQRLAALGVPVAPHDPPRTRAGRVRTALGAAGEPLARALDRLDHQRYAVAGRVRNDRRWWRQFRAEAARLAPRRP